ncbi:MAG: Dehydrogenase, partial [Akkermansiaceae bacterium]|nr:Dehydrogenase [Akkermansiaceae bacterium]
ADPESIAWLRSAIHPHELLQPTVKAASVLSLAPDDPLVAEADIILGQPSLSSIALAEKVRWIQVSSAGYTRYDTPEFRADMARREVAVTNSSHVYDQACAEHVFSFILAQARSLPAALASQAANGAPEWLALRESCQLLQGQSVLIFGYGAIAACLVKMLAPFDVEIVAVRRAPRGDEGITIITPEQAEDALAEADHVINILPDNPDSRNYFDAGRFAAMTSGSSFYNIGRGTTVVQEDLAAALTSGHLASAWLDVTDPEPLPPDHPLRAIASCHITPHIAGGQRGETRVLLNHFVKNFRRYLERQPLVNRIL